jgi:hypothetical protein
MRIPPSRILFALLPTLALLVANSSARQAPADTATPDELIRRAVANETAPRSDQKYMFQQYKKTLAGAQTTLYVETRDAMAGLVIAYNDQPLTEDQRKGELSRVQRFIDDPDEMKKKQRQEKDNADRVMRIIRALPDAFIYQRDGVEMGRPGVGKSGEELVRLSFVPNPKYDPPTHVEQTLTGMQGTVLIDTKLNRIARIDGTLQKDVGFGWGILGHLDQGGHFMIEQGDVGDGHWQTSHMDVIVTGKILFFKSINVKSTELYSDFHAAPSDLSFAQGVDLLKKHAADLLISRNK